VLTRFEVFKAYFGEIFTTSDFVLTTSDLVLTTSKVVLTTSDLVFAIFEAKKRGNHMASPIAIQIYNIFQKNPNGKNL
jgi:hypothetical protein